MTSKYFCPICGASVSPTDKFCQNCGAKLAEGDAVTTQPVNPQYQQQQPMGSSATIGPGPAVPPSQPAAYQQPNQPYQTYQPYQPYQQGNVSGPVVTPSQLYVDPSRFMELKAGLGERFLASLIDSLVWGLASACTGLGACVIPFKDSIPSAGVSVGKEAMHIKVVDYKTGAPMTVGQGLIRNLCGYTLTLGLDVFVPICTADGRRVGDYMAGTIVIKDM